MIRSLPIVSTLAILCLCLSQSYCSAQEKSKVPFGKVTPADFTLPSSPIIDSNANAVILSDIGEVHFIGNKTGWFSPVLTRHTRIKILNKKAFDAATIQIYLREQGEYADKADNIQASTFNLENGQVMETKVDKKDIFVDKQTKNQVMEKFTMPAVREGSIIEYTYAITYFGYFLLPDWEFQSQQYPCLWSEFRVEIPQTLYYIFVRQGVHPWVIDKGSQGQGHYKVSSKLDIPAAMGEEDTKYVDVNTVIHRWAMKDIPALHAEDYLSTPVNYIDKIYFQLSKIYNGQDTHDVLTTWKMATEELLKQGDFGGPLADELDLLRDAFDKIGLTGTDPLERARKIYYYVSSHFTCTNHSDPYIYTNLSDVLKKSSGTVGDINLLLIALFRKAGLQADPVLLSTRGHGFNLTSYPVLERLNYVIARVNAGSHIYYLDAAHPQLGFGHLAGNCYNGHARIISEKDSGSVYFEADSLKERKTTMVMLSATDKGLEGNYQATLGEQESYNLRTRLSRSGEQSYYKSIQTSYGEDADVSNIGIDSLQRPEDPVKVYYDLTLKQGPGSPVIYLNPMFAEAWRENPFKAVERKYPVEMPYTMDNVYLFTLQIPDGYHVEEMPKSTKVSFNGDQGFFEYLVDHQGSMIQLRCHLKLNRAWFPAEDYATLRDFFAFVVKKESETIVLKKQ